MLLVHLAASGGGAQLNGPAREARAVAGVIGCVNQRNFGSVTLQALNEVLGLSWLSIYSLHVNQPPQMHAGASLNVPDRTWEAFDFYRQGVYLSDRTFDDAKEKLQSGEAGVTHWHAREIPAEHRQGIYTRNGLQERASLVRKRNDGSLLAVNLYRHEGQGAFRDTDIDTICRLGEPLLSCVNLHMQLTPSIIGKPDKPDASSAPAHPLALLPKREREVCDRLLRGWTHEGIAGDLGISAGTVKTYRDRAFDRLGIHHRNELFALALAWSANAAAVPPSTATH